MSGILKRLFHELFGDTPIPDEKPANALVATLDLIDRHEEATPMQTADQQIIAAIFNDLYSKVGALSSTISTQAAAIAALQAASDAHSATFDTSLVSGYVPPASTTDTTGTTDTTDTTGTTGTTDPDADLTAAQSGASS